MANKNEIPNVFKQRVQALGIKLVNLATISGYKESSLYKVSRGKSQPTEILMGYVQLLEILKSLGLLQIVLEKYSIKVKGSAMTPTADEIREQKIQELNSLLEKAEIFKSAFANLDSDLSEICKDIKIIRDDFKNDSQE